MSDYFSNEGPFGGRPATRWFFSTASREEAWARLLFLVEQGRSFGALVGEPGVGKTLLLTAFVEQLQRQGIQAAYVDAYGSTEAQLLEELCLRLGLTTTADKPFQALRAIEEYLYAVHLMRQPLVVCLDHLDRARSSARQAFSSLVHRSAGRFSGVTFVAAFQVGRLSRFASLMNELADLRVELHRFTFDETALYVNELVKGVGCSPEIFDMRAIEAIHAKSGGLPREINRLCELSLLAATAEERTRVETDVVEAASAELFSVHAR